jgi:L-asparaginase II
MTAEASPIVAEVVRNGFVESVHHGRFVAVDGSAQVLLAVGDVAAPMFARSSLKPLQTLGMLAAGWDPDDDEQVALACASHSGEPAHLDVVRRILAAAGLDESALDNTPGLPLNDGAADDLIRSGGRPDRLHQNCSGKHAAMLATCVANGWPVDGYRDPAHPVQQAIRRSIEEAAGERVEHVAVDGCGAALFSTSLTGLARAFAGLATATDGPAHRVARAMRSHPWLVGGTGRDVTTLMEVLPGLVAKDGAEGVWAVATADGVGVAVKIDDGSGRARTPVLVEALRRLTAGGAAAASNPALDRLARVAVLGHGEPVGEVRPAFP